VSQKVPTSSHVASASGSPSGAIVATLIRRVVIVVVGRLQVEEALALVDAHIMLIAVVAEALPVTFGELGW
jgi:hypothetical protein